MWAFIRNLLVQGGRGHKVQKSPVHCLAESQNIPVFTPKSLRTKEEQYHFSSLKADLAIVIAYGLILPRAILEAPKWGCVNIHASILPRWRGAAPIQRCILAGDSETGVTLMKMDEGLDTGPILAMQKTEITSLTTASSLFKWMSEEGANLLKEILPRYIEGQISPFSQPEEGVTHAPKLLKEEGLINWNNSAQQIDRQIRALNPWPGVYFYHNETVIKISSAQVVEYSQDLAPGTVLPNLTIVCGHQALKITALQKPGSKVMTAEEFCRGYDLKSGTRLSCPAIV